MDWIYLSPHFDDAIYSCGAAIWMQTRAGDAVQIWTICAGDPPDEHPLTPFASLLHTRWGLNEQAVATRRAEDAEACALVGASTRRFDIPDCIYRYNPHTGQPVVQDEEGLWSEGPHPEPWLVESLRQRLARDLHPTAQVAAPLAIGNHTDHHLVRQAAEALGRPLWYYADTPYAMRSPDAGVYYAASGQVTPQVLTAQALVVWQQAGAAYASQLSTFWADRGELDAAFAQFAAQGGGRLLQPAGGEAYPAA